MGRVQKGTPSPTGPLVGCFDDLIFTASPACSADTNCGGRVDAADLLALLASWGPCKGCSADFDDSGDVGVKDLLFLLGAWGPCPPKADCPADFDDSDNVGVKDLLFLLGAWGPCP